MEPPITPDGKDKRAENRHSIESEATIQLSRNGEALDGTTLDISASGMLVRLKTVGTLKVGEQVTCAVVTKSDSGEPLITWGTGKVVRITALDVAISLVHGTLDLALRIPCPHCAGSGKVKSIPTLCHEIQAEARKMAEKLEGGSLTLRVNPEIAKALQALAPSPIEAIQRWTKKSVTIEADPTLHWEQYDVH